MKCTKCGAKTYAQHTDQLRGMTRRYRACKGCGHKFHTREVPEAEKGKA